MLKPKLSINVMKPEKTVKFFTSTSMTVKED